MEWTGRYIKGNASNNRIEEAKTQWNNNADGVVINDIFSGSGNKGQANVTNCVCIALGSLEKNVVSVQQFALPEDLIKKAQYILLKPDTNLSNTLVDQTYNLDPASVFFANETYTQVDKRILQSRGFTVVKPQELALTRARVMTFIVAFNPPIAANVSLSAPITFSISWELTNVAFKPGPG